MQLDIVILFLTLLTLVSSTDYYQLLGVRRNASTKDIKRAYRKMAAIYHPDRNQGDTQAEQMFLELSKGI
jgi:molecular chaperone DnaJ